MRISLLSIVLVSTLLAQDKTTINLPLKKSSHTAQTTVNLKEEELRLMLQSFLFSGDVAQAYDVARIGYQKYPDSIFWNQQMIDILKWSNNSSQTLPYEIALYQKNQDSKLRDTIIAHGLSLHRYADIEPFVMQKATEDINESNTDQMIFLQNELGNPQKAADALAFEYQKDSTQSDLLTKELRVCIQIGNFNQAKKVVEKIESKNLYTVENLILLFQYYLSNQDLDKAYNALSIKSTNKDTNNTQYYKLLSDTAWYMQDFDRAVNASEQLISMNQERLVDHLRVIEMQNIKDPILGLHVTAVAYEKYRSPALFYTYAKSAIEQKKYEDLQKLFDKIDKSKDPLNKEARYWLVKAKLAFLTEDPQLVTQNIDQALSLGKGDVQIEVSVFWFYLEHEMYAHLQDFINRYENEKSINSSFYLPFTCAYYQLNDLGNAKTYMKKVLDQNETQYGSTDIAFLEAYIFRSQNNHSAYLKKLSQIAQTLRSKLKADPSLQESSEYWINYLNATLESKDSVTFEKNLKTAKIYLSTQEYHDIQYAWSIQKSTDIKEHELYIHIRNRQLWNNFSDDIVWKNHFIIANTSDAHIDKTSLKEALKKEYKLALAESLTYDILDTNNFNDNPYIEHLDLTNVQGDELHAEVKTHQRDPLLQQEVRLSNRIYLDKGWDLYTSLNYFNNSTMDSSSLDHLKENTYEAGLGLRKRFNRSYIGLHVSYENLLENFMAYGVDTHLQLSKKLKTDLSAQKNIHADDSMLLSIAGKKDMLSGSFEYKFTDTISFATLYEKNYFSSQDDKEIGQGEYARFALSRQYRLDDPDIKASVFYDIGSYKTTNSLNALMNKVQNSNATILPDNFYNVGAEFSYGLLNSTSYSKAWKPYFSVAPYYSGLEHRMNIGASAGYSGQLYHQDRLDLGVSYYQARTGIDENIVEFFLKYQFLYLH